MFSTGSHVAYRLGQPSHQIRRYSLPSSSLKSKMSRILYSLVYFFLPISQITLYAKAASPNFKDRIRNTQLCTYSQIRGVLLAFINCLAATAGAMKKAGFPLNGSFWPKKLSNGEMIEKEQLRIEEKDWSQEQVDRPKKIDWASKDFSAEEIILSNSYIGHVEVRMREELQFLINYTCAGTRQAIWLPSSQIVKINPAWLCIYYQSFL